MNTFSKIDIRESQHLIDCLTFYYNKGPALASRFIRVAIIELGYYPNSMVAILIGVGEGVAGSCSPPLV